MKNRTQLIIEKKAFSATLLVFGECYLRNIFVKNVEKATPSGGRAAGGLRAPNFCEIA